METLFKRFLLVALCCCLSTIANSAVYKYIDENGNTAYSDKPVHGAKKLKLRGSRKTPSGNEQPSAANSPKTKKPGKSIKYKSLEVLTPKHEKLVDSPASDIEVVLLATPKLEQGHQLVITLNGKIISKGRHANITLSQVPRGSHTLASKIIDNNGATLIDAKTITFHVKRPIIEKNSPLAFERANE